MQIKKFIAPTLKEASEKMKEEFGDEAIILGSRVIDGDRRFNHKRMFEITAGFEEKIEEVVHQRENFETSEETTIGASFAEELQAISGKIYNKKDEKTSAKTELLEEPKPEIKQSKEDMQEVLKKVVENLHNLEIQKPLIVSIVDQLKKYKNFLHSSNINSYVLSTLASMIPVYNFEVRKTNKPKIVSLVGPTGVGKTTCIAKLALISKILHNLEIGLISVDTFRLGAIDQLKIFAEISNIDLRIAYEPSEIKTHIENLKKKDVIFIDTAGRSQKNTNSLIKTKEFLSSVKVDETYLVLNSASSTKTLYDVAEKFKIFDYKSFIFTKIDEAVVFGNILNTANKFNIPVSFLTNGQTIPDDIISADSEFIANMIYTGKITK